MEPLRLDPMAIPDFIAGFIQGMVNVNDLEAIEACGASWGYMGDEIQMGIDDIKEGGWNNDVQAALMFGLVLLQIPQALDTCHLMSPEIQALEDWAQIFTNPAALAADITKNLALHHKAISADTTALTTDWDAAQYWDAGEDLAQLMTDLIGPVDLPSYSVEAVDVDDINDFLSGLLHGMIQLNDLTEIEACRGSFTGIGPEIITAIQDFKAGGKDNIFAGLNELWTIIKQVPTVLSTCKNMGDDILAIETWAMIFTDQTALISDVTKNLLRHPKQITNDKNALTSDWAALEFYQSGMDAAQLVIDLVGPIVVPTTALESCPYEFGAACYMRELCGTSCDNCNWSWPAGSDMNDPDTACRCMDTCISASAHFLQ